MSRSSEVLFFFNRYRMSWRMFQTPFSLLSWPGCCLLSPTAQHIKRWGVFSLLAHIEPHLSPKSTLYSVYRQLILDDGPRAIPILSSHVLGIS